MLSVLESIVIAYTKPIPNIVISNATISIYLMSFSLLLTYA